MNIKDAVEILRPINCLMGSLTVLIGLLNTRTGINLGILILNIILGILTYIFIAGSGMIINDIYDIEIDKINRPQRPIPSGRISLIQAKWLYFIILSIGISIAVIHCISLNLGFLPLIIAIFFGLMGWVYAKWGKKSGFWGNIIVSISFSIGMIYGAMLNNSIIPPYIFFFFLTSFFLLLSREVIKGCEDIEGDKKQDVKTLAIRIGIKRSTYLAGVFSLLAILFFILPAFTSILNRILFIISMIFGLIIVSIACVLIFKSKFEHPEFKRISLFLKIGAFLGLVSFILASI